MSGEELSPPHVAGRPVDWPLFWSSGSFVLILVSLISLGSGRFSRPLDSSRESDFCSRFRGGALVIAGGGDLPPIINRRFWELAGGKNARLVIIPAYFAHAADITSLKSEWRDCRFESVQVLQASSRDVSHQPGFADPIRKATSVWFSGGEQSWLANLYSETELETRLQELLDRGGIIGGTSAGAAIMSRTMIEEGHREPKLRRGLDLFKDAVIDQHFFKRNRMQRMSKTLIRRPHLMGFGIDEGTALFVQVSSGRLGIIGNSYVMACIPEPDTGSLRLEVLKAGDNFDIDQLRGLSDASASTELTSETVDLDDSYPT